MDRKEADAKAREFFDDLWSQDDPWALETSEFEARKYDRQIELLADRTYQKALEIGCGAGVFSRKLAEIADRLDAIDVSQRAIDRAQRLSGDVANIRYRTRNVMDMDLDADGPWDLIVMNETIYYLGWLYSFFDLGWLAKKIFDNTARGGRFLMANTRGGVDDYLLLPWIIETYGSLFVNVGFSSEREATFLGEKDGVALEVPMSLFRKA